jgi:hypothetical protein
VIEEKMRGGEYEKEALRPQTSQGISGTFLLSRLTSLASGARLACSAAPCTSTGNHFQSRHANLAIVWGPGGKLVHRGTRKSRTRDCEMDHGFRQFLVADCTNSAVK